MSHLCSTPCNSTSTSVPVKLGLRLLAGAPPVFAFRADMILISLKLLSRFLWIRCACCPVVACPYKELAGRLSMQIQVYVNARSIYESAFLIRGREHSRTLWRLRTHFHTFMNPAGIFCLRCF